MKELIRKKLEYINDYFIITLGLLLYAVSWTLFILPAQITGGGVSGIGAVIYFATGFPIGVTYFLINVVLVLIAIRILGPNFGIKTIYSMAVITLALTFTQQLVKEPLIDDTFLSSVLGGGIAGIGLGIVFTRGGSTGGTDIIAAIVNKYRNISPGRIILYCDVIIIASSWLVLRSIDKLVYGYVAMAVTSYALDAVLSGANRSAQMLIFSRKYDEIADFINQQKYRGVTVIDGVGWYSKENVKVVISVVRKRETGAIFRKIKEIDPNAFISMGSVMGVYGQGFDQLKL
ncbi:MAG: YitT family protein [Prolixibacteraceae bacterium]|nr:YitT family protein [Prolixibacteraceae bacterium]NLX29425.1 YitT family protein [Bacteroidales bacterium]HNQ36713.1 YitT family protein [Prolixibacteraceae bacterium]HPJ78846.1 YitT family protein [Prolixibacteraceae bacterium]HRV88714.1 YitT family protein [Prolixibacteraceae bacterium]